MKKIAIYFVAIIAAFTVSAQTNVPVLEREISLHLTGATLPEAIEEIAREGNFSFTYNPAILEKNRTVTVNITRKTVRETLDIVFKGSIAYKAKGNYIILSEADPAAKQEEKTARIEGYIKDKNTGSKVPNASVYQKETLASAVSDNYGYYSIEVPKKNVDANLHVSKAQYTD